VVNRESFGCHESNALNGRRRQLAIRSIFSENQRGAREVRRKTTADSSAPFVTKNAANFAQDDKSIIQSAYELQSA
jgi:hypothetical protein